MAEVKKEFESLVLARGYSFIMSDYGYEYLHRWFCLPDLLEPIKVADGRQAWTLSEDLRFGISYLRGHHNTGLISLIARKFLNRPIITRFPRIQTCTLTFEQADLSRKPSRSDGCRGFYGSSPLLIGTSIEVPKH